MAEERISHLIVGEGHPYKQHSPLAPGNIETDRNGVIVIQPLPQLIHSVGQCPAFELHLDLTYYCPAFQPINP